MRYRVKLYKDGEVATIKYANELFSDPEGRTTIQDWITEWKLYNQLKGDWEIRITPEEN